MPRVPDPPWLDTSPQAKARRQEIRNAKLPEGSRQPASGGQWNKARDNKVGLLLIETRRTDSGSYTIKEAELNDLMAQARRTPPGMTGAMQIDLGVHRMLLLPLEHFTEMKAKIAYLEDELASYSH